MKRWGAMLGTRMRDGRQVYTYMFRGLFAEILYKNDNPQKDVESFMILSSMKELNEHLHKEIKSVR